MPGNGRCDDVSGGPVSPEWMRSSWPPKHPATGSSPASGDPEVCGAAPADGLRVVSDLLCDFGPAAGPAFNAPGWSQFADWG